MKFSGIPKHWTYEALSLWLRSAWLTRVFYLEIMLPLPRRRDFCWTIYSRTLVNVEWLVSVKNSVFQTRDFAVKIHTLLMKNKIVGIGFATRFQHWVSEKKGKVNLINTINFEVNLFFVNNADNFSA